MPDRFCCQERALECVERTDIGLRSAFAYRDADSNASKRALMHAEEPCFRRNRRHVPEARFEPKDIGYTMVW